MECDEAAALTAEAIANSASPMPTLILRVRMGRFIASRVVLRVAYDSADVTTGKLTTPVDSNHTALQRIDTQAH